MKPRVIRGERVSTASVLGDVNPSDSRDVVDGFAEGGAAEVRRAVAAAREAFPLFAHTTPLERAEILARASAEMRARREELGRLLSREEGKTLPEGIAEATRAAQIVDFFAGEALRLAGETVPSVRPGIDIAATPRPAWCSSTCPRPGSTSTSPSAAARHRPSAPASRAATRRTSPRP